MIRVLGVIVGIFFIAAPFLMGTAGFIDVVKANPNVLLARVLVIVFIIYGVGGAQVRSKLDALWIRFFNRKRNDARE